MYNIVRTYLFACHLFYKATPLNVNILRVVKEGTLCKTRFLPEWKQGHFTSSPAYFVQLHVCTREVATGPKRTISLVYYFDNYIFWNDVTYAQDSNISLFHGWDANVRDDFCDIRYRWGGQPVEKPLNLIRYTCMLSLPFVLMLFSGEDLFLCVRNFMTRLFEQMS